MIILVPESTKDSSVRKERVWGWGQFAPLTQITCGHLARVTNDFSFFTKTKAGVGGGGSTEGAVTLNSMFLGAQAFGALIQEHAQFLTTSTEMWFGSCVSSTAFPSSWDVQPVCGSLLQQPQPCCCLADRLWDIVSRSVSPNTL